MSDTISPQELAKKGKKDYQDGSYLEAAHNFKAAAEGYATADDLLTAAEMANNCSVAFLQAGEADNALIAVEGTEQVFENAGDVKRQGMAAGNRAAALEALDRVEEALEAYELSAALLHQAGEDQLRASAMQSLSALQFRTGKQLQALATMQSGLEDVKRPTVKQKFLKRLLKVPFNMMNKSSGDLDDGNEEE